MKGMACRATMKEFIGTCVENPFNDNCKAGLLCIIVEQAKQITKKTFLRHCYISKQEKEAMKEYPHDFEFYRYRTIYFYTHSAIEHFYE